MKSKPSLLVLLLGMLVASTHAEEDPGTGLDIGITRAPLVLDLAGGKILGAKFGMEEADVRKALAANHIKDISKVTYPGLSLLQTRDIPGLTFNFRGGTELNEIYTNNRTEVALSNGLQVGQTIKEFLAKFGEPLAAKRLPSGIGVELIFPVGNFEVGAIVVDKASDIVSALTLRKVPQPKADKPGPDAPAAPSKTPVP
jgi:hypothetical protein